MKPAGASLAAMTEAAYASDPEGLNRAEGFGEYLPYVVDRWRVVVPTVTHPLWPMH
jgi:hypothetical protein